MRLRLPSISVRPWHPLSLSALTCLYLVTLPNAALWQQLWQLPEVTGWRGLGFGLGLALGVAALTHALLCLLNWPYLLKPVLAGMVLMAAVGAHFMGSYGIVIDDTMIVNVLQTDPREALDLFNLRLLAVLGLLGLLPALWLARQRVRPSAWWRRLLGNLLGMAASLGLAVLCLLAIYQDFASVMRNHTQLRYLINPLNTVYALGYVAFNPVDRAQGPVLPIGQDAQMLASAGPAPTVLVVVGETARAMNFSLNGYERPTNPELARLGVVSLRNVWSCGTSTATSLPCMFSHLDRPDFEARTVQYETLVDVLHKAGLAVLWIDNQSGCKGVCARVPQVNTASLKVSPHCDSGECHDEVMLHGLAERLAALPAERRAKGTVVFLHQMGSHGPAYHKRVPAAFKRFTPECASNALQQCTREQVLNAYDNTLLYTDHVLAKAIGWLRQRGPSALVYVSDHGESLGENNLYLHGLPYAIAPDVQKRVPWITWVSPPFAQQRQWRSDCLQAQADRALSHDHFFHSVLGLVGVRASEYRASRDIYSPCMRPLN